MSSAAEDFPSLPLPPMTTVREGLIQRFVAQDGMTKAQAEAAATTMISRLKKANNN